MQFKTQTNSVGRIILIVVKWIFSTLFILVFLGSLLQKAFLTSIFWLLLGLLLLPPLSRYWQMLPFLSNRLARLGFAVALFFAAALTAPENKPSNALPETSKSEKKQKRVETKNPKPVKAQETKLTTKEIDKSAYTYEVLKNTNTGAVQNFDVFVTTEDKSKSNVQKIANGLRKKLCSKNCNISIYDDKKAWKLEREYDDLEYSLGKQVSLGQISQSKFRKKMDDWDKKNYCFMAEHMLGFLSFESEAVFYYMFKDAKYKDLGGKHPK